MPDMPIDHVVQEETQRLHWDTSVSISIPYKLITMLKSAGLQEQLRHLTPEQIETLVKSGEIVQGIIATSNFQICEEGRSLSYLVII